MKKFTFLVLIVSTIFSSCTNDNSNDAEENQVALRFTFNHFWKDVSISSADFNQLKFTNENGEQISMERLRYIISNITLTDNSGNIIFFDDYNLVDVTNNRDLSFSLSENITTGTYQNIAFTFGFVDEDNIDGIYQDLNVANFNVPAMSIARPLHILNDLKPNFRIILSTISPRAVHSLFYHLMH